MYVYDGIKDTSALVDWSNYNILTGFSLDYISTPTSYIQPFARSSTDNMVVNMTLICVINLNWVSFLFVQKEAARKIQPSSWNNKFCIFNGKKCLKRWRFLINFCYLNFPNPEVSIKPRFKCCLSLSFKKDVSVRNDEFLWKFSFGSCFSLKNGIFYER